MDFSINKNKKRILLFENSLFLLEVYLAALIKANYEVKTASNLEECLNSALAHPDLIIIDITTPKVNGIEILRLLKENFETKDIPVVILAGVDQEQLITQVLKMGAQGFLIKDRLTPSELVSRMGEFLGTGEELTTEQKSSEY